MIFLSKVYKNIFISVKLWFFVIIKANMYFLNNIFQFTSINQQQITLLRGFIGNVTFFVFCYKTVFNIRIVFCVHWFHSVNRNCFTLTIQLYDKSLFIYFVIQLNVVLFKVAAIVSWLNHPSKTRANMFLNL